MYNKIVTALSRVLPLMIVGVGILAFQAFRPISIPETAVETKHVVEEVVVVEGVVVVPPMEIVETPPRKSVKTTRMAPKKKTPVCTKTTWLQHSQFEGHLIAVQDCAESRVK